MMYLGRLFTFWKRYTESKLIMYNKQYEFQRYRKRRVFLAWKSESVEIKYTRLKQKLADKFHDLKVKQRSLKGLIGNIEQRKEINQKYDQSDELYSSNIVTKYFHEWRIYTQSKIPLINFRNHQIKVSTFSVWKKIIVRKNRLADLMLIKDEIKTKYVVLRSWYDFVDKKKNANLTDVYAAKFHEYKLKSRFFNFLKKKRSLKIKQKLYREEKNRQLMVQHFRHWNLVKFENQVVETAKYHLQSKKMKRMFDSLARNRDKEQKLFVNFEIIRLNNLMNTMKVAWKVWSFSLNNRIKKQWIELSVVNNYEQKKKRKIFEVFKQNLRKEQELEIKLEQYQMMKTSHYFNIFRKVFKQRYHDKRHDRKENMGLLSRVFGAWVIYSKNQKIQFLKTKCIQNERRLVLLRNSFQGLKIMLNQASILKFNEEIWSIRSKQPTLLKNAFIKLKKYTKNQKRAKTALRRILHKRVFNTKKVYFFEWTLYCDNYDENKRLEKISQFLSKRFLLRRLLRQNIQNEKIDYVKSRINTRIAKQTLNIWINRLEEQRMERYLGEMSDMILIRGIFKHLKVYTEIQRKYKMATLYSECLTLKKCLVAFDWNIKINHFTINCLNNLARIFENRKLNYAFIKIKYLY